MAKFKKRKTKKTAPIRKEEKKSKFFPIFLSLLMIGAVAGYFTLSPSGSKEIIYGDHKVVQRGAKWFIKGEYDQGFDNSPLQVENIKANREMFSDIKKSGALVITSDLQEDPNSREESIISYAKFSTAQFLQEIHNIYSVNAYTSQNPYDLPIFNCENATSSAPVLYFKISNETKISYDSFCITAEAKTLQDMIKAKDRVLYGISGVI